MELALALNGGFAHELHRDFLAGREQPFVDRPEPSLAEAVGGGEGVGAAAEEGVRKPLRWKRRLHQIRRNSPLAGDLAVENDGEEEKGQSYRGSDERRQEHRVAAVRRGRRWWHCG